MIVSYIEGDSVENELTYLSESEQFQIGLESGKELKRIHQYRAPNNIEPWFNRKLEKHKKYVDQYLATSIRFHQDKVILSFIEENIKFMKGRPNLFQHDDFHIGNIIVKNGKLAGIIDFNSHDWGDPVHEFIKIGMFSRQKSISFCIGQILGYHDKTEPPESFWILYSLYLAMCLFSSVVWSLKFIPEEVDCMLNKIYTVIDDHNSFKSIKPSWYKI
ncbi:Phosphotransferase enzyme family protein [Marininema mesophilum]|uniref:Phosphotransferase enzyme family protein n=2 Tax=Marininema mesophilum TaxID=1048340 RepID=A0A1H2PY88_9BACL|nr:Phosphotransferase enzyme family protein [Marininema mesophilum]